MDERELYDERQETRKATLNCPHCHQAAEYDLGWFVRTKKRQLPPRADEREDVYKRQVPKSSPLPPSPATSVDLLRLSIAN